MRRLLSTLALAALLPLANPLPSLAQAVPPGMASLVADRVQILGDGLIVAQGNVAVLYGDARLTASRITYDRAADSLQIEGPLTLAQGDSILLLADAAQLSTDLREGLMTSARVGHATFFSSERTSRTNWPGLVRSSAAAGSRRRRLSSPPPAPFSVTRLPLPEPPPAVLVLRGLVSTI